MPIFVNINLTTGADDGTSWSNAYRGATALQKALGINPISTDEIWVAQGDYFPSQRWNFGTGSVGVVIRTESFKIPDGAQVYGGFTGDETLITQRNIIANPTILSGDIGNTGDPSDNAYHVVFFYHVSNTTLLDGFTITDGNADGGNLEAFGGGIFNSAFNSVSSPSIRNCIISNNQATSTGGGLCSIVQGGTSLINVDRCIFSNNTAGNSGGAVSNDGIGSTYNPLFTNCVFVNNEAPVNGGAVYNDAAIVSNISSPVFQNCVFVGNSSENGGAICNIDNVSLSIMSSTFFNNSANQGSIIYNGQINVIIPTVTITNSILWNDPIGNPLIFNPNNTTITYSDIAGGAAGVGNINSDPLFINSSNPIGPDNVWSTNDDGLALQPCSPCVSSGTSVGAPDTDIIGNPRPDPPSMGAYEVPVFSINPMTSTVCQTNSGILTLSSTNNVTLLWQSSEDEGTTWEDTTNSSSILEFENLATNTDYRVQITTEDCIEPIFSNIARVNVENCTTTQTPTTNIPTTNFPTTSGPTTNRPIPTPIIPSLSRSVESIGIVKVYDWTISTKNISININL